MTDFKMLDGHSGIQYVWEFATENSVHGVRLFESTMRNGHQALS